MDELKTKEDIQKASMLISDLNEIGPSNYKDFFINRGYMKMCESPEDIPILSMILNKHISYCPSASDSDVLKIIKEKLYLYEFFDKGPDIARENMQSYDYSHIGYTLFDIAQGIKTKEQIEAVFELIKAIKSGISYERNTIALTINKFVKTKKDIEPYTNFIKEFRNMRNLLSRSDNEECINTLYKIFTEEPRFTYREVTELLEQPNGNGTIEQINRLNSIIKLKDKGLSGKLVIDLCCSTLDDNGKFVQNRLDILLRENNPVDMILKILDEPGGRFTANLTLLKEAVTDYKGHVDKEAFAKLLELYQTKIPDVTHITNIYKHCDSTGGTVNSECIKAVEGIIDSGYPYDTINSILSNMVGVWNTLPKEEFVSILKNMIKANPKILERPQDLCSKFNRFAKATNYGMMKQETEAAIKLMKNGICPDCDRLFDDESNFIRLFRKARKENGEIDNTKIDKAIELYKLSIPHYLVDHVIDYDITKIRQLYDLGFRDLNLFYMYDVSDKARDFILKNIPIDKLEYADIHIVNLAVDFLEYNSVLEMDKVTKQKFLNCIMRSNGYLLDAKNTKDCIKILPTTPEEYISTVQKLAKSLNIEIKKLGESECKTFRENLDALCNVIEKTGLSNLEKVELTYPQASFVKEVKEITSGLTPVERAQLYDLFGFSIKDNKLSGYPKAVMEDLGIIDNPKLLEAAKKIVTEIQKYTDNNFITVKDYPELASSLKALSSSMPELYRQLDGSKRPVSVIKTLQKIIKNPSYKNLSESNKKILTLAALLHKTDTSGSTVGSAFDAFFIAQKFGFTESECKKLYKIIQTSDTIEKFMSTTKGVEHSSSSRYGVKGINRQVEFDYIAFLLKEDNNFELARMLYGTTEKDGFTRYFDKMLEQRIKEIKSHDFVLPQTNKDEILKHSTNLNIKGYNVKVAYANDIPDFYAFIHTPERGFASSHSTSRDMKFANFDVFKIPEDDKVICTCYIGNGKYGTPSEVGFIFDIQPENMYVGLGYDMSTTSKNTRDLMIEFFRDTGLKAADNKGLKFEHRIMIANTLKEILNISDEEYIKRVDRVKKLSKGKILTVDLIEQIDEKLGKAYKEFLSRDNTGGVRNKDALLRGDGWNEVLVSNPEVKAIYTKDLDNIPEEYLIKAQEENLPIVIIK